MTDKPTRDEIRVFRSHRLIDWMDDHPMATRRELLLAGRYAGHGVTTEGIWYDTYPTLNRLLRTERPGLAVTEYRHPKMFDGSTVFWWITGDSDYQRAHVARLLGHAVTRMKTMEADAKVETMRNSANPDERRVAGEIIDLAHQATTVKAQFDLMPMAQSTFVLSQADLLLLRGWAHR